MLLIQHYCSSIFLLFKRACMKLTLKVACGSAFRTWLFIMHVYVRMGMWVMLCFVLYLLHWAVQLLQIVLCSALGEVLQDKSKKARGTTAGPVSSFSLVTYYILHLCFRLYINPVATNRVCWLFFSFSSFRDSFPFDQQFNILMRFIVDQTQTPNLKVSKAFTLKH